MPLGKALGSPVGFRFIKQNDMPYIPTFDDQRSPPNLVICFVSLPSLLLFLYLYLCVRVALKLRSLRIHSPHLCRLAVFSVQTNVSLWVAERCWLPGPVATALGTSALEICSPLLSIAPTARFRRNSELDVRHTPHTCTQLSRPPPSACRSLAAPSKRRFRNFECQEDTR